MSEPLKSRLAAGEACLGAWQSVSSPQVAEAMASCDFDWMAMDMEHSLLGEADIHAIFAAIEKFGCAPMARLPSADPYLARRILDAGAAGLIVPVVESADAFAEFAAHCYYPPKGRRGVGVSRQMLWGDTFDDYVRTFAPVLAPQIETLAGVEAADALAALDVVDGLFLGPYDLSADLGRPGDFTTPEFNDAVETVKAACLRHGKAPGFHQVAPDADQLQTRLDEGYRLLAFGTDMFALRSAFACLKTVKRS